MRGLIAVTMLMLSATAMPMNVSAGYSCEDTADGGGFGGNAAACGPYSCKAGASLSVSVSSVDEDATVSGSTACADETAACTGTDPTTSTCDGNSVGTTTASADDGTCSGQSSEAWSSDLTVTCEASGGGDDDVGGTLEEVCDYQIVRTVCNAVDDPVGAWHDLEDAVAQALDQYVQTNGIVPDTLPVTLPGAPDDPDAPGEVIVEFDRVPTFIELKGGGLQKILHKFDTQLYMSSQEMAYIHEVLAGASDADSSAHIIGTSQGVVAFTCQEQVCVEVEPTCHVTDQQWYACRVG